MLLSTLSHAYDVVLAPAVAQRRVRRGNASGVRGGSTALWDSHAAAMCVEQSVSEKRNDLWGNYEYIMRVAIAIARAETPPPGQLPAAQEPSWPR